MHHGIYSIDILAYSSRLRRAPPWSKLALSLCALALCLASAGLLTPVYITLGSAFICTAAGGTGLKDYLRLMTIPAAFIICGTAAIAISFSTEPCGQYTLSLGAFCIYTSDDALRAAAMAALKALGSVSAMYMLSLTTPIGELMPLLRRIHVPKLITELMVMIYRYIFILYEVYGGLRDAAASRLGTSSRKAALRSFALTAASLFTVSLKRANTYYDALESRCYTGVLAFLDEDKHLSPRHAALAVIFQLGAAALMLLERRWI